VCLLSPCLLPSLHACVCTPLTRRPPVPRAQRTAKKNTRTAASQPAMPPEKRFVTKQSRVTSRTSRVPAESTAEDKTGHEMRAEGNHGEGSMPERKEAPYQEHHADRLLVTNSRAPPLATSIRVRKHQQLPQQQQQSQQPPSRHEDLVIDGPTSMSSLLDQAQWQSAPPLSPTWLAQEEARRSAPGDAIFDGMRMGVCARFNSSFASVCALFVLLLSFLLLHHHLPFRPLSARSSIRTLARDSRTRVGPWR